MSKNQNKKVSENWKKFLKENLQEADRFVAPFDSSNVDRRQQDRADRAMGFKPKGKGISAYPVSRQRAAELMAKGITKPLSPKDKEKVSIVLDPKSAGLESDLGGKVFNVGDLATFQLGSREVLVADGQRCDLADENWNEHGARSLWHETVLWTLDTADLYPGHDGSSVFFFDKTQDYSEFIQLLKAAIADKQGTKGVIGECGVRMANEAQEPDPGIMLIKNDGIYPTESKIVVGTMNVISGKLRPQYYPSVVITFGDLPPGKQYSEHPYFFTPEGAAEFLKIIEKKGAEAISKFGSIYRSVIGTNLAIPAGPPYNRVYASICKPASAPRSQKAAPPDETVPMGGKNVPTELDKFGLPPGIKI